MPESPGPHNMSKEQLFAHFEELIRRVAIHFARKWGFETDELTAQGYYIFLKACKDYEPNHISKATFETYFNMRLHQLNDYCYWEFKRKGRLFPMIEETNVVIIASRKSNMRQQTLYNETNDDLGFASFVRMLDFAEARTRLSSDAQEVLQYILYGHWDIPGKGIKLKLNYVQAIYQQEKGWVPYRTLKAWRELKTWYRKEIA